MAKGERMTGRPRPWATVALACTCLLAAACGSAVTAPRAEPSLSSAASPRPGQVVDGVPPAAPYSGPLFVQVEQPDDPSAVERSGAAGLALECEGEPYGGGQEGHEQGLLRVQQSPEAALASYVGHEYAGIPTTGYRLERRDSQRVLYSFDVDRAARVAVIAADGVRDERGDRGWRVESWATCDPSEWPAAVTDELGIQVWHDAAGRRVPVTRITSSFGHAHCGTQEVTFLQLGELRAGRQYVGRPTPALRSHLATTYDAAASLPDGVTDTGFRREGRSLWLDRDGTAAYLVSERDRRDVQRWPAAKEPIRCG